jgi:glutathione S-transferase
MNFRGLPEIAARLRAALEKAPYLMGDRYSLADLILAATYGWKRELLPDDDLIRDWAERCLSRPSGRRAYADDAQALAA